MVAPFSTALLTEFAVSAAAGCRLANVFSRRMTLRDRYAASLILFGKFVNGRRPLELVRSLAARDCAVRGLTSSPGCGADSRNISITLPSMSFLNSVPRLATRTRFAAGCEGIALGWTTSRCRLKGRRWFADHPPIVEICASNRLAGGTCWCVLTDLLWNAYHIGHVSYLLCSTQERCSR
jgi:hypothetical protein